MASLASTMLCSMKPNRRGAMKWTEHLALGLYSLCTILLQPFLRVKLWVRSFKEPAYGWRVAARFGHYETPASQGHFWIHAVSLGETRVAGLLIEELRRQVPGIRILLTHGTASGWLAGEKLLTEGDRQEWLPWDTPVATLRFLDHHKPIAGVMIETEVWPSLVHSCVKRSVPLYLVNARKSKASFEAASRLRWLALPAYAQLRGVLAQSAADVIRLEGLGATVLAQTGNIKFDAKPSESQLALGRHWRRQRRKPVLLLVSSRDGEEIALLDALATQGANVADYQCLIVPRHIHRIPMLEREIQSRGLSVSRRCDWTSGQMEANVWLGDSYGELSLYYAMSDLALLGGSFEPFGGQNLIEAAACGCPIVLGPHTFNFEEAASWALSANAAKRAENMSGAVELALAWLRNPIQLDTARQAGLSFAKEHCGASLLTTKMLLENLSRFVPASTNLCGNH
jgi:3-deoxy-D-manno-octulosonic-acid transferase